MHIQEIVERLPHLRSPYALGYAHSGGSYSNPPHLKKLDEVLMGVSFSGGGKRVMVNMPYQHGKSERSSEYWPAWHLMLYPDTRIVLVANSDSLAEKSGLKVREIVERWGKDLGVTLRKDSKAKGEWRVQGMDGGMICRGVGAGVVGRPSEIFLIDDLIRLPEEALSVTTLESHWNFWKTVVFGRLRKKTSVVMIGTRWTKHDLFGKLLLEAKRTGRVWERIVFKALAEEGDILGRKVGEALWPENVTLDHLQEAEKTGGRWWKACWQQEPEDEEGSFFKPGGWPLYKDLGDAWSVPDKSMPVGSLQRRVVGKQYVSVLVTVDWASSEKKTADYTAIGVFGVLPDGRMMVLEVVNERIPIEGCVPRLAQVCERWHPTLVGTEVGGFQTALMLECRRYRSIPEPRELKPEGKNKLLRAIPAINMGETGRILLPEEEPAWKEDYMEQLAGFTATGMEHDDMVDVTAYAAQQAGFLRGGYNAGMREESMPILLTPGKSVEW